MGYFFVVDYFEEIYRKTSTTFSVDYKFIYHYDNKFSSCNIFLGFLTGNAETELEKNNRNSGNEIFYSKHVIQGEKKRFPSYGNQSQNNMSHNMSHNTSHNMSQPTMTTLELFVIFCLFCL